MSRLRTMFMALLPLMATLVPTGIQGPMRESSPVAERHIPERFEFIEGHAYVGSDSVKWEHERLVFIQRVADMKGTGSFVEKKEELSPTAEAWQRFWERIDSLSVWQWKVEYSDPKRSGPDGESWVLTLRVGAKQLKSRGYNAAEPMGNFAARCTN
jgi:hypothetical protein